MTSKMAPTITRTRLTNTRTKDELEIFRNKYFYYIFHLCMSTVVLHYYNCVLHNCVQLKIINAYLFISEK